MHLSVADEGEVLSSYKAMCTEVKQLLEDGLEDKTLVNLKDHLAAVQPQHLVSFSFCCLTIGTFCLYLASVTC